MNKIKKALIVVLALVAVVGVWKISRKVKLETTVETDLFSQGQVELNQGHYGSAIEIFETFLKRDPTHVPTLQFKLKAEMLSDRWQDAELTAEKMVKIDPVPANRAQLAEVYRHNGKTDLALKTFNPQEVQLPANESKPEAKAKKKK